MATTPHKSATSVTLAPLAERSPFEHMVHKYWIHAAVLFVAVSGWILYSHQQGEQARRARDESWNKVAERTTANAESRLPSADPAVFESLSGELAGTEAGPWMLWLQAKELAGTRDYDGARALLQRLKSEHPTHFLVSSTWALAGQSTSMVDTWLAGLSSRQAFEAQHPGIFAHPAIDADAPRVRLKTDAGEIQIALFDKRAPEHVRNFLEQVDAGSYVGTLFHRIDPQVGIDGGDPLSKDPTRSADWGTGGKDRDLAKEESGLYHFAGALSAGVGSASGKSGGSQFSILSEDHHDWDGERVVFGVVEQGLDVVRTIAKATQTADAAGRPEAPAAITELARVAK